MDYAHGYRLSFYVYPDFFLQIYTGVFTIWCLYLVGGMILLMEKNPANQLRLVVYPIIYRVLAPSKRWLFGISEPSRVPPFVHVVSVLVGFPIGRGGL